MVGYVPQGHLSSRRSGSGYDQLLCLRDRYPYPLLRPQRPHLRLGPGPELPDVAEARLTRFTGRAPQTRFPEVVAPQFGWQFGFYDPGQDLPECC
jgi:hypothetical protein